MISNIHKIIKRFKWRMFCFKSRRNANIIEKMLVTHPVRSVHSFVLPEEFATNSIPTNLVMTHEFIAGFNISPCHIKLLDLPISMKGVDYNITEYDKQVHYTIYKILENWYVNPIITNIRFAANGTILYCTFKFNKLK